MNALVAKNLYNILVSLASDCNSQIKPYSCVLETTEKATAFHYRIPNPTRRQVVSWANLRTNGLNKDIPRRPCVKAGVYGGLLNSRDPQISKCWNPKGNWGTAGEAQAVIYEINDAGYRLILYALIMSANELIRRSSLI